MFVSFQAKHGFEHHTVLHMYIHHIHTKQQELDSYVDLAIWQAQQWFTGGD
jgi:hypothetical protein